MDNVVPVLVMVIGLGLNAAFIASLINVFCTPLDAWRAVGRSRMMTALLIVVTGGIGGLYYWHWIRPLLVAQTGVTAPPPTDAELRAVAAHRSLGI